MDDFQQPLEGKSDRGMSERGLFVDDAVASGVGHYIDRINRGERLSTQDILREHPEFGKKILEHLGFYIDFGTVLEDELDKD